jgi:hypothetical protein
MQHARQDAGRNLTPFRGIGTPGARARQLHAFGVNPRQNAVKDADRRRLTAPLRRVEIGERALPIIDGGAQTIIGLKSRGHLRARFAAQQAQGILSRKNIFRLYWFRHVCNCPIARCIQLFTVPTGTAESAESSSYVSP